MAQDEGQEKTEEPTPKRLSEAREKGQIARSKELNTMSILLVAGTGLMFLGENMIQGLVELCEKAFQFDRLHAYDSSLLFNYLINNFTEGLFILMPLFGLLIFIALLSPMALGGWSFSTSAMAFKASKMDPVKGLGRIFGWKGVIELFKALGKFLIVGSVAVLILWLNIDNFLSLTYESFNSAFAHVGDILSWSFISIAAALIIIAAIDVPFQLWDNKRQLKMSRQEIKDEYKQTEGSPEVKGKIRNLQLEAAKQRMMEEVPQADVVVTNPTHYAVALRYDQDNMQAPSVIAKGRGLIAANIREIAAEHNIAQLSSPPLARALYHSTELGQEIPAGLYMAVAQVLAYVYQLKSYTNGDGVAPSEILPEDLSIPDDLRKDD